MNDSVYENARQKALELLGLRDHTVHELKGKLLQRSFPPETVEKLCTELLDRKYLDDRRAVENYLRREGLQGHHSLMYLKNKLFQKGIQSGFVDEILHEAPEVFREELAMERALQKSGKAADRKKMARLLRDGFRADLVYKKLKVSPDE
jgi:regulatory protein